MKVHKKIGTSRKKNKIRIFKVLHKEPSSLISIIPPYSQGIVSIKKPFEKSKQFIREAGEGHKSMDITQLLERNNHGKGRCQICLNCLKTVIAFIDAFPLFSFYSISGILQKYTQTHQFIKPGKIRLTNPEMRNVSPWQSALAIVCSRDFKQNSDIAELSTRVIYGIYSTRFY